MLRLHNLIAVLALAALVAGCATPAPQPTRTDLPSGQVTLQLPPVEYVP
jgi:hypothetical protein